jgi:lipopolysaccharide/colanic/teichoic acid biosynthesis glycosyltransferase
MEVGGVMVDRTVIPESFVRSGVRHNGSRAFILVVADCLFAVTVFCVAADMWSSNGLVPMLVLVPVLVSMLCSGLAGAYRQREDFLSLRFAVEHFLGQAGAAFISTALVSLLLTYGSTVQPSRGLMITWPFLYFLPSLFFRRMLASRERRKRGTPIIAVVGSEGDLGRLRGELHEQDWHGRSLCFDPELFRTPEVAAEVIGPHASRLSAVVLGPGLTRLSSAHFTALVGTHLGWAPVYTWEGFFENHLKKVSLESLSPDWIFQGSFRLGSQSVHQTLKRGFDLVSVLVLGVVALPMMVVIACFVRCSSPGPVLFFQHRRGRYGRTFNLVKFRTMTMGNQGGTTVSNDKRIIRGGAFLRKFRLDELPQLWNILLGDMSLIGPRPEWIPCADEYAQLIPFYDLRHLVRPGLTGWAQVNYPYGQDVNDARAKLSYDLFYIRNCSLLLDFVTVVKTGYVMLFGRGGR